MGSECLPRSPGTRRLYCVSAHPDPSLLPYGHKLTVSRFSSLIDSQGQPLIDLSLYVSSLNYTSLTRSAYALILPWPNSWIYPPRIRAAAKERSNHLGLSSLDIDSVDAPQPDSTTSQIPTHLLKKSKETVTSLLGQGQQHNQFRLESLTSAFFAPLQDLLAQKPFLLGTAQLSSLDCLAVGHLSLALFPEVPHPWLQTSLKDKFPFLASYTERISRACFGPPINALNYIPTVPNDPRRKAFETDPLPWVAAQTPSLTSVGATILENIADSLPVISQIRTNNRLRHAAADPDLAHMERSNLKTLSANQRKEFLSQVVTVVAGISAFVGYMYYHGVLTPEADYEEDKAEEIKEASNPGPFGEAGALLFGRMPAGKPGEPGPR
jgi:sorting and assembly machinery component 37